jgi:hypothetical protein
MSSGQISESWTDWAAAGSAVQRARVSVLARWQCCVQGILVSLVLLDGVDMCEVKDPDGAA